MSPGRAGSWCHPLSHRGGHVQLVDGSDLSYVEDGTPCGPGMLCLDHKCLPASAFNFSSCPGSWDGKICFDHGVRDTVGDKGDKGGVTAAGRDTVPSQVCSNEGKCICRAEWTGKDCSVYDPIPEPKPTGETERYKGPCAPWQGVPESRSPRAGVSHFVPTHPQGGWCHHPPGVTILPVPPSPQCHHPPGATIPPVPPSPWCHHPSGVTILPVPPSPRCHHPLSATIHPVSPSSQCHYFPSVTVPLVSPSLSAAAQLGTAGSCPSSQVPAVLGPCPCVPLAPLTCVPVPSFLSPLSQVPVAPISLSAPSRGPCWWLPSSWGGQAGDLSKRPPHGSSPLLLSLAMSPHALSPCQGQVSALLRTPRPPPHQVGCHFHCGPLGGGGCLVPMSLLGPCVPAWSLCPCLHVALGGVTVTLLSPGHVCPQAWGVGCVHVCCL